MVRASRVSKCRVPFESTRARDFPSAPADVVARWSRFGSWDRPYFPSHVGVVVEEVRLDYCRMRLPFRPELEQPMGLVHGGAIATLIDVVVVPAIGSRLESDTGYSTVDLHIQYLSALVQDDAVAEGWVVRRGRSIMFCRAEVFAGSSGRLLATGSLTYAMSPIRPPG